MGQFHVGAQVPESIMNLGKCENRKNCSVLKGEMNVEAV